jgi:cytoskeleton protein RodZ
MGERKRSYFENGPTLGEPGPGGFAASDPAMHEPGRTTLGSALRSAREGLGFSLDDMARDLRIRRSFLQALEEGRFKDLPGVTYATGFLRTYAEHLGLDPETAVRQFKEEASGAIPKSELYMPKPVPEGRVPGGAMLLLALVLAGGLYGGWYYLTSTGRDVVDLVPPLPDRLASALDLGPSSPAEVVVPVTGAPDGVPEEPAVVGEPPAEAAQVPAELPAAEGMTVAEGTVGEADAGTAAPAGDAAPATSAPAAPDPAATAPVATAPAAQAQPGTEVADAATAAAQADEAEEEETNGVPAPPTALTGSPEAAASPSASPLEAASSEVAVAAPPSPPAVPAPAADAPTGRVYGLVNGASRIQLRATQDSWIQVRDGAGDLLFARVLRPGDVYRAPDRSGLKLVTGNAGGLVAVVDGVEAPRPFGQTGQVMRDVALDPQRMSNP